METQRRTNLTNFLIKNVYRKQLSPNAASLLLDFIKSVKSDRLKKCACKLFDFNIELTKINTRGHQPAKNDYAALYQLGEMISDRLSLFDRKIMQTSTSFKNYFRIMKLTVLFIQKRYGKIIADGGHKTYVLVHKLFLRLDGIKEERKDIETALLERCRAQCTGQLPSYGTIMRLVKHPFVVTKIAAMRTSLDHNPPDLRIFKFFRNIVALTLCSKNGQRGEAATKLTHERWENRKYYKVEQGTCLESTPAEFEQSSGNNVFCAVEFLDNKTGDKDQMLICDKDLEVSIAEYCKIAKYMQIRYKLEDCNPERKVFFTVTKKNGEWRKYGVSNLNREIEKLYRRLELVFPVNLHKIRNCAATSRLLLSDKLAGHLLAHPLLGCVMQKNASIELTKEVVLDRLVKGMGHSKKIHQKYTKETSTTEHVMQRIESWLILRLIEELDS